MCQQIVSIWKIQNYHLAIKGIQTWYPGMLEAKRGGPFCFLCHIQEHELQVGIMRKIVSENRK